MANKTIKQIPTRITVPSASDWTEGQKDSDDTSFGMQYGALAEILGMHPGSVPNFVYRPGPYGKNNAALAVDQQLCYPLLIPRKMTFSGLAIHTVTQVAASAVKAAIYSNVNGRPGVKLKETANPISTATATTSVTEAFSGGNWTPDVGVYWMATVANGAPTVVCVGSAADPFLSWLLGVTNAQATFSADINNMTGGSNYATGHPSSFGAATYASGRAAPLVMLVGA